MQALKIWFKRTNITTHTTWLFLVAFAGLFDSSPTFRAQFGELFAGHPVMMTRFGVLCSNFVIITAIWAKISNPAKAASGNSSTENSGPANSTSNPNE